VEDASFFDMEFAVPGDESASSDAEELGKFNFAVASEDVVPGGGEVVAVDAVVLAGVEMGDLEQRPQGLVRIDRRFGAQERGRVEAAQAQAAGSSRSGDETMKVSVRVSIGCHQLGNRADPVSSP
jgi:hypothetical protein